MHFKTLIHVILLCLTLQAFAMDHREAAQALLDLQSPQNKKRQRPISSPTPPQSVCTSKQSIRQSSKKKLFQMPQEAVLRERLDYYCYFLNHSDLIARIAGKSLTALQIEEAFQESCKTYLAFIKHEGWTEIAREGQELFNKDILPLLFIDHPEGLRVLTLLGLYTPKE